MSKPTYGISILLYEVPIRGAGITRAYVPNTRHHTTQPLRDYVQSIEHGPTGKLMAAPPGFSSATSFNFESLDVNSRYLAPYHHDNYHWL